MHGVTALRGGEFTFAEDFHEVVTFLALGAITGGNIAVKNSAPEQFPLIDRTLRQVRRRDRCTRAAGRTRSSTGRCASTSRSPSNILQKIEAAPWPYLPVDLLPIFVALGVKAEGSVMYWNKVYEGAMGWTSELSKFGAHAFMADPHRIITFGGKPLAAAEVESPYIIRVAIALLMLAASIPGELDDQERDAGAARASAFRREHVPGGADRMARAVIVP